MKNTPRLIMSDEDKTVIEPIHPQRVITHGSSPLNDLRLVTRAHQILSLRPKALEEGKRVLQLIESALQKDLDASLQLKGRLLDAPIQLPKGFSPYAAYAVIELSQHGAHAILEVEYPVLVSMLSMIGGGAARQAPISRLTRIEEAGFGFAVLLALGELRKHDFWQKYFAPRLLSLFNSYSELTPFFSHNTEYVAIEVEMHTGALTGLARVLIPKDVAEGAWTGMEVPQTSKVPDAFLHASISLWPFAGPCKVPRAEFSGLANGDVLVFPNISEGNQLFGACRLVGAGLEFKGKLSASGYEVQHLSTCASIQEVSMSSSLPIEVEIELAKIRIPLSELHTIRPGAILPLHVTPRDLVLLRVGDTHIAQAELVNVEGQIGARIVKMLT